MRRRRHGGRSANRGTPSRSGWDMRWAMRFLTECWMARVFDTGGFRGAPTSARARRFLRSERRWQRAEMRLGPMGLTALGRAVLEAEEADRARERNHISEAIEAFW